MISGAGAMNPVCPREDGLPYGMPEEYAGGAMNLVCPREDGRLEWGNGVVSMLFDTAGDSPVRLCNVAGRGMGPIGGRVADDGRTVLERDPRPIVEVRAANTGSQDNRLTLIATVAGSVL